MTQQPIAGSDQGRRYGGADPDERRARRRADLVDAGLDLFGTEGFAPVPIKRICEHAGVTQRYFYESFADKPALLGAVYDACVDATRARTVAAALPFMGDAGQPDTGERAVGERAVPAEQIPDAARAILGAFIDALATDPRRARVMLVEIVGVTTELERTRQQAIHGWAHLILMFARGQQSPTRVQRLAAIGLVGAVTQLLVDWYTSHTDPVDSDSGPEVFDIASILDVCVELFVAAHRSLLA